MTCATSSEFMSYIRDRHPHDTRYHQAVAHVIDDIWSTYSETDAHRDNRILERLTEPDRVISFRVTWEDDEGKVHVNRGFRVQQNNAIGPYKGGIRFHPSVNEDLLKFLAFEQTFKNALTGLPMGGGKGGADFNPKGRSDREIMRFCYSFMTELQRHIGPDTDIPAGDINVGAREIGFLFGAYRKLRNEYESAMTGKALSYGGSPLRTEATGFGLVQFVAEIAKAEEREIEGQRIAISGAGNVATHAAECATVQGAKVISLSDSGGLLVREDGFSVETIEAVRKFKRETGRGLDEFSDTHNLTYEEGKKPWHLDCHIALPCATQNEVDKTDADALVDGPCWLIGEGANMPLQDEAMETVKNSGITLAPAKAANAGGVAVSGLEIMQNQMRKSRTRQEISDELSRIMGAIHDTCREHGSDGTGKVDYVRGANIAGYLRVADAMVAQGLG
jgi:glutamate dehydrogenase (NADP+)